MLQMIGSMTVAAGKPLPDDLQSFLAGDGNASGKDTVSFKGHAGSVYVAMGTTARLLEPEVRGMAVNLAALHRPVLWKISDSELPGELREYSRWIYS